LKVQAIQVPTQQIQKSRETVQEKMDHLNLEIAHLKHHNQTIRSGIFLVHFDAIKALFGILEKEPRLFIVSLEKVTNSIGLSLMDEQDTIRRKMLDFSGVLFDKVDQVIIIHVGRSDSLFPNFISLYFFCHDPHQ
jgi:hypothetical protein